MEKRNVFLLGLLVALLAIGLIFVGCADGGGSSNTGGTGGNGDGGGTGGTGDGGSSGGTGGGGGNNGGTNQFIGTWNGTDADGDSVTLVITTSNWTLTTYNSSGIYTYSGNTATIKDGSGSTIGTATISGSTLTVTGSGIPYTPYTLTKTTTGGGGGGGGGGGDGGTTGGDGGGTTVPNAPTGVNATANSASSISVSWSAVSGATSYDVYFEIGSSITKNFAGTVTGTSYTHTGLQASTTYYYYIKAVNSAGSSNYSSSALATTQSSGGGGGGGDNQTTYTITFNANGGSVSPTSGTTGTNGRLTTLPTPTRSGYTFNGWYTSTSGGTQVTTSTVFSQNSTIYAQWTSSAPTEYRLDQPIFGTCSKSGNNLTINWTLTTTGTTPNGLYTYTSPSNIIIQIYNGTSFDNVQTLSASARTFTLNNYALYQYSPAGVSGNRVTIRVYCTSGSSSYDSRYATNTYFVENNYWSPSY